MHHHIQNKLPMQCNFPAAHVFPRKSKIKVAPEVQACLPFPYFPTMHYNDTELLTYTVNFNQLTDCQKTNCLKTKVTDYF